MTEIMIVSLIMIIILSIASISAINYRRRNDAKVCKGNQLQFLNALAEFGNNSVVTVGTPVSVSQLVAKGFLGSRMKPTTCPGSGLPYATNLFYGVSPVCPSATPTHFRSPTAAGLQ